MSVTGINKTANYQVYISENTAKSLSNKNLSTQQKDEAVIFHNDRDTAVFSSEGINMCYRSSVDNIKDYISHTAVDSSFTSLFGTLSETLQGVREQKGGYDCSDIADSCGYAYAKCYSDIKEKYAQSSEEYHKADNSKCTEADEISWLDNAYQAMITWHTTNARIAAEIEQFSGNIAEVPRNELDKICKSNAVWICMDRRQA